MSTLRAIIALVTFIYLDIHIVDSYSSSSTPSVLRRTFVNVTIPQSDSTQYLVSADNFAYDDDASIYYATCSSTYDPDFHLCNVSRVTPFDTDGSIKLVTSCENLRIKVDKQLVSKFSDFYTEHTYQRLISSLTPLTKGHVAFTTSGMAQDYWLYTIVNINNCSVTNDGESLIRWSNEYGFYINEPFIYHDSVDILIRNDTFHSTSQKPLYRVRYGYDGQKLDTKPLKFLKAASYYPVKTLSDKKGFYSIYMDDWRNVDGKAKLILTYAEPNSNEDHLIATDASQQLDLDNPSVSINHELLSACWPLRNVSKHELRCIQANTHEVLHNMTVKISFPKYDWLQTLNLPNDGSMLLVEGKKGDNIFHVRRLTRDGRGANKWFELKHGLDKSNCIIPHLTKISEEKERDEICFNISCYADAPDHGWYVSYERLCVLKSIIMETLN